ncbi:MAG: GNAT family N-acetyltransferase [Bacillota bacterium]
MDSLQYEEDINIQKAVTAEARKIYELVNKAFAEYRQGKHNPDLKEKIDDIKNDIKNNIVLVLKNIKFNNKIVGTLRLIPEKSRKKIYLKKFAISPDFQGQGYGTMLFKKAEVIARNKGYKAIYLYSSTEDKKLVRFYQKLGFKCTETSTNMGYERGLWVKKL